MFVRQRQVLKERTLQVLLVEDKVNHGSQVSFERFSNVVAVLEHMDQIAVRVCQCLTKNSVAV